MAIYKNSFWNTTMPDGNRIIECNKKPIEYRGFLIYERVKGTIYDVVKDGLCIGMYAGINGAKRNIDIKNGACGYPPGELDPALGITDCKRKVCDLCLLDEKICGYCNKPITSGDNDRIYDSGCPFHTKCYYECFPWLDKQLTIAI